MLREGDVMDANRTAPETSLTSSPPLVQLANLALDVGTICPAAMVIALGWVKNAVKDLEMAPHRCMHIAAECMHAACAELPSDLASVPVTTCTSTRTHANLNTY